MDSMEDAFIELGKGIEMVSKEISFELEKTLKKPLDFIIKIFNKYSERYLSK